MRVPPVPRFWGPGRKARCPILRFFLAKGGKPIPPILRAEGLRLDGQSPHRSCFADNYHPSAHNGMDEWKRVFLIPDSWKGSHAQYQDRKSTRLNSSHANISYAV